MKGPVGEQNLCMVWALRLSNKERGKSEQSINIHVLCRCNVTGCLMLLSAQFPCQMHWTPYPASKINSYILGCILSGIWTHQHAE